ncbi:probable E3 ubiquitin-protein ligase bre1 [Daktulosphaira vitifoliae]|uniref:probable E3 ubiquitin-protein ligase bre1 n=1 Tax=Daktulosphaira vitifoliae TaxID=58002 RepID=UPI0021AAC7D1|nr:probable E3 ubiquitin-protein ligase bre1 [Daktulosphaira vitifoliae]
MKYPVLLDFCLYFFAVYGIPSNSKNNKGKSVLYDCANDEGKCVVCTTKEPNESIGLCERIFCKDCISKIKKNKKFYNCPFCNQEYTNLEVEKVPDEIPPIRTINITDNQILIEAFYGTTTNESPSNRAE